jgi:O-antigen ligase/tetratricopeptide (TPR) repeat protein
MMKKLLFIFILLTTLTPLVLFEKLPFPFVTEKTLYFRLIIDILLIIWAIVAYQNPEYLPRKTPLNIALLFLGIVTLLTAIFGHDFQSSFWSGLERMEGFIGLFHTLIFFFVLSNSLKKQQEWNIVFLVSCAIACVLVLKGIFIEFDSLKMGERLFTSLGNPSYLGLYLILHLFLVGFLLLKYSLKIKIIISFIIPIFLIGIMLSQSRSAIFGLLIGLLLVISFVLFSKRVSPKLRWSISVILILSSVGFLVLFKNFENTIVKNSTFLTRVIRVATSSKTGVSRLNNWKIAYQGFKEKPIMGWGQENYQYVFTKYFLPQLYDDAPWYDRSHNFFLDWLVSGGILGFLAFLAPFGLIVWFSIRSTKLSTIEKGLFLGVLGSYFANNFFGFDNITSTISLFLIMAYWQFKLHEDSPLIITSIKIWGVFICILISSISFYYGYLQPLKTSKQISKMVQETDLQQTIFQIQEGYKNAAGTGMSDFAEQAAFLSEKVKVSQVANELKNEYFHTVGNILQKENDKHPLLPRLLSIKSSIDADRGDFTSAINGFEKVRTLAPKRHINLMQLANVYIRNNQFQKALNLYDEIYKINHYGEIYFFKSLIYSDLNDTANLFKSLQKIDSTSFFQKLRDVRFLYGKHQNLKGFVHEMDRREIASEKVRYTSAYPKEVYFEWAMAAYESHDIPKSAELVFRYIFGLGEKLSTAKQAQEAVLNGRNPAYFFK